MSDHDYANCQDPAACDLCTAHGAGEGMMVNSLCQRCWV